MKLSHLVYSFLATLSLFKNSLGYKINPQTFNSNQLIIEVEPAEENTEDYVVPLALIQDIYGINSEPISIQALSSYLETEKADSSIN
ncbi:hypothetical protein BMR1_02g02595 [Babesia microti strain RI]|uniref:Uncharacterized protein n=1 Tax=Babesia microti (strain RI) TaxID=1133968 RepID=A0A1R4AAI8_BABMR|nr:hypothetical protein BMR1_02g02595 [Babesia microti strain RI]SJK86012.1 hypothetical protein BMR1_02g02595 [Babesia microti strain RI]|eukprot:XP_021338211.1 hypothetical protein BMR1_02g02595 [Babesia microti strain RI]